MRGILSLSLLSLFGLTARGAEAPETTPVEIICGHEADLVGKSVFVEFMGRPTRAKFKSVSEDAVTVMVAGGEVPIPLGTMKLKRLVSMAKKVATGQEFLGLIRHLHKTGEAELRDALMEEVGTRFPDMGAELKALGDEISPPPPQPEEKPEEKKDGPVRRPAATRSYPALPPSSWECLGPGGGGAMYTPTISPHDPKVGIINCDMGGVYLTRDGGVTWHILPMVLGHGVAFSPSDPNVMFVGTSGKMFRSADGGVNWTAVTPGKQFPMCSVWFVLADPDDGRFYWISYGRGALESGHGAGGGTSMVIGLSTNGGTSFTDVDKGFPKGGGMVEQLAIDRASPIGSRTVFAATSRGFYRSRDGGKSWEKAPAAGLSKENCRGVVSLWNKTNRKTTVLVSTSPGGLFRSEDGGETFAASGAGIGQRGDATDTTIHDLAAGWDNPNIVYAGGNGVWKSVDGGRNWKEVWVEATKYAGWLCVFRPWSHNRAFGMGVCPTNPLVVWYTGGMAFFASNDGGASWIEQNCNPYPKGVPRATFAGGRGGGLYGSAPHFYWGGQLEVTFCYQVQFDPHRRSVMYAGYADIGGWRSEDGGKSWTCNLGQWNRGIRSEWRNSCYDVAFDHRKPGRFYVAVSGKHNLPGSVNTLGDQYDVGGVAVTNDGGKTLMPFESAGLPNKACATVLVDKRSADRNVLYAGFCGAGMWRSMNDGGKWERMNGLPSNALVWRIRQMHDGTLLACCVANRPGGLWKFDDTAQEWKRIDGKPRFESVTDLLVGDASRPGFVMVAVQAAGGGAFLSMDGGATFSKVYQNSCKSVECSPDGRVMYVADSHVHYSIDGGRTWRTFDDVPFNLRFRMHNDLTLNPRNPGELWVGTGGCGMFKGPALPGIVRAKPGASLSSPRGSRQAGQ